MSRRRLCACFPAKNDGRDDSLVFLRAKTEEPSPCPPSSAPPLMDAIIVAQGGQEKKQTVQRISDCLFGMGVIK